MSQSIVSNVSQPNLPITRDTVATTTTLPDILKLFLYLALQTRDKASQPSGTPGPVPTAGEVAVRFTNPLEVCLIGPWGGSAARQATRKLMFRGQGTDETLDLIVEKVTQRLTARDCDEDLIVREAKRAVTEACEDEWFAAHDASVPERVVEKVTRGVLKVIDRVNRPAPVAHSADNDAGGAAVATTPAERIVDRVVAGLLELVDKVDQIRHANQTLSGSGPYPKPGDIGTEVETATAEKSPEPDEARAGNPRPHRSRPSE